MSWLSLLLALLKMAQSLFDYVERNKLLDAGGARAIQEQMEELNGRVKKALAARDAVARDADAGKLHDDDGYRKD